MKKIKWKTIVIYIEILMLSFFHAFQAGHYSNFNAINGTFQNFNPVRRLITGQIPYRDFSDYLGLGHLYIGYLFTALFGGNYNSSLIAFSFLSFLSFVIIVIIIGYCILKDYEKVAYATCGIVIILLFQPPFIMKLLSTNSDIYSSLNASLNTGNSARFLRGMILPVSVFLILFLNRLLKKFFSDDCLSIVFGISAGLVFPWSSDYGMSSWLCLMLLYIIVLVSRKHSIKDVIKGVTIAFSSSVLIAVLTVEILTFGHMKQWLLDTFGTGGYQGWYYNSEKSFYIFDIDISLIMLIQILIAIIYFILMIANKGCEDSIKRYGFMGYMNMTGFCAVNEYKLLSGGKSREVAITVLFITILFEIISIIVNKINVKIVAMPSKFLIFLAGVMLLLVMIKGEWLFNSYSASDGIYVEQLGGNLTSLGEDIIATSEFLDGEAVFATYASGQEVVEQKFQPSGTDYIIHVLGDNKREEYLRAFNTGDFKYVATISKDYNDWEYWIERANWFFYRELYEKWHPVFANEYELYWERNRAGDNYYISGTFEVDVEQINESTVRLVLNTEKYVNGTADVYLKYDVKKNDKSSNIFVFQRMLGVWPVELDNVKTECNHNYLRAAGEEYVPVSIRNGNGELTLTAEPQKESILQINQVSCDRIYTIINEKKDVN